MKAASLQITANSSELAELEALMREGHVRDVRARLEAITRPDPSSLTLLAQLSWRAGAPELGLRWLRPVVRPSERRGLATTDSPALAEYAQCLFRLGATSEAAFWLADCDAAIYPRVHLYQAALHTGRWDHAAAVEPLRKFVDAVPRRSYEWVVGMLNLAAAFVAEQRHDEAIPLIRELVHETSLRKLRLLQANVLEVFAQSLLDRERWTEAALRLDEAKNLLGGAKTVDALYVDKWAAFVAAARDHDEKAIGALHAVSATARARGAWETVRECLRLEGLVRRDGELFRFLYFGTPHPAYRERLFKSWTKACGEKASSDLGRGAFHWNLGGESTERTTLDAGEGREGESRLIPGGLPHRLLLTLASDFVKPWRVPELFGRLFPDERFNPQSAPRRVHQAVAGLRHWLEEATSPVTVEQDDGQYRLNATSPVRIAVASAERETNRATLLLQRLATKWPAAPFSAEEAAAHLEVSGRTARRLLSEALADEKLIREGARTGARYRFKSLT